MLLDEMFEEVLARSGQFILANADLEIEDTRWERLVKTTLRKYNAHHPHSDRFNVVTTGRDFAFTINSQPLGVPDWVSEVIPIRMSGVAVTIGSILKHDSQLDPYGDLVKQMFIWQYKKPTLYLQYAGEFDVEAVYSHRITDVANPPSGSNAKKEVSTISDDRDDIFFDLLTGRFLQALGRYRRAFTLQEIPITTDAETLVSEGTDLVTKAEENLGDQAKWWLAWS